jgi:flagellar hook assembly protein FlgD
VFTARGERVRRLVDGERPAGMVHQVAWDGRDDAGAVVGSGVYYCRLEAAGEVRLQKMVLLK